jgi:hypothetical protein
MPADLRLLSFFLVRYASMLVRPFDTRRKRRTGLGSYDRTPFSPCTAFSADDRKGSATSGVATRGGIAHTNDQPSMGRGRLPPSRVRVVGATQRFRPIFTSSLILHPRQEGHAYNWKGLQRRTVAATTRRGGALSFAVDRQDKNTLLMSGEGVDSAVLFLLHPY